MICNPMGVTIPWSGNPSRHGYKFLPIEFLVVPTGIVSNCLIYHRKRVTDNKDAQWSVEYAPGTQSRESSKMIAIYLTQLSVVCGPARGKRHRMCEPTETAPSLDDDMRCSMRVKWATDEHGPHIVCVRSSLSVG